MQIHDRSDPGLDGSDWPVCTCAAGYPATLAIVENWASALNADEQRAVFGETCAHFYNVLD